MSIDWIAAYARPTGWLGSVIGHLMAVRHRERNAWVLSLLDPQPGERILEVGFGPGVDLGRVADAVRPGSVAGIDHSEVMVKHARRRNHDAIAAGRIELRLGRSQDLPWPDASFDKAFAINAGRFWDDGGRSLAELRRVLRPGGLLAVAAQPRGRGASEARATETAELLEARVRHAGFVAVRLESKRMRPASTHCALGHRP